MKEAAGEANLTVVAIILIAVVVAVATPLVTTLMKNASKRSCCNDYGGVWNSGKCQTVNGSGTYNDVADANYYDSDKKTCKGAQVQAAQTPATP